MNATATAITRPTARRATQFAATRFTAPVPGSRHVARPAICDRLDDGRDQLRVVVGPPGSGKTSLLAEWFRSRAGDRACWLNVDQGDRDGVRFWHAFLAAVRSVEPAFASECLDLLRLDARVDHELLEGVLVAIDQLDRAIVVVVDDFHLAAADVSDHLRFLLGRGIRPLQLVIGTRREPELGLHRLRLDDQLCELRESDLQFERADAVDLLERLGVRLRPAELDIVLDRTRGWAAGLHLTALALRDAKDPREIVGRLSGTNQVIAHYLWSEVFDQQPPDMQRFLLDTSIVDELSPHLAAALSPGNPVTLLDVETANLLLHRVDAEGTTFRYHPLLSDMLRFRLQSAHAAHEAVLHERAAQWHDEHGDPVAAFRHRWRAGRRGEALRTLHGTVLDVVYDALPEMTDLERALTDDDIRAMPGPTASFATALLVNGLMPEAERLADRIEAVAGRHLTHDDRQQLLAVHTLNALVLGDTVAATELGRQLETSAGAAGSWTLVTRCASARAHIWQEELDEAEQQLRHLLAPHATTLERSAVHGTYAHLELARGHLSKCSTWIDTVLDENRSEGPPTLTDVLLTRAVLGTVLLERGELRAAERELRAVEDTGEHFRVPAIVLAKQALSRLWTVEGDIDAALAVAEDSYRLVRARPPRSGLLDHIRCQHIRALLAAGAVDEASVVLGEVALPRLQHLLSVEVALARDDLEGARRGLGLLAAHPSSAWRHLLDLALASLTIAAVAGEPASHDAGTVLELAEPEGFVFPLVGAGPAALAAVQEQARHHPRSPYIERVMRLRPSATPRWQRDPQSRDLLTERERTVLRYMATAMSYPEIAADLFVSLNTVKSHVRSITQKLDVNSRQSAVDRAIELHYL